LSRINESCDQIEQDRFPGATGTKNDKELTTFDADADIFQPESLSMSFFFLVSVSSRSSLNMVRMIKSAMNIAFIVEELCLFRISKMSQKAIV
jgi:hypothetical protein